MRVAAAYFGVLTSEDELTYAKANEDAFRQQYEQSDQRFKVGLSAITDVYQAKAYYEAAKSQTIAAQNALNDAREALTQITGKPTGELKKLRDDLPMQPPAPADQDSWVKQALQTNPNLLAQQKNVDTAEHNISAARAGHLPTITAGVNYGKGRRLVGKRRRPLSRPGLDHDRADPERADLLRRRDPVAGAPVDLPARCRDGRDGDPAPPGGARLRSTTTVR